jgi:hypothetical protein
MIALRRSLLPFLFAALALIATASAAEEVVCTTSAGNPPAATSAIVARFDFDSMAGEVKLESEGHLRCFRVKAVPSAATYLLMFEGYGKGDQRPAAEKLAKHTSVVARLVAYGETNHLFFDADFNPGLKLPPDGLVCK